jgi:hypothetical protein
MLIQSRPASRLRSQNIPSKHAFTAFNARTPIVPKDSWEEVILCTLPACPSTHPWTQCVGISLMLMGNGGDREERE